MSLRWKIYWLLFAVTMMLYLVMVLWSLPLIASNAGGLTPFDLRPTGYDFADVRAFLAALTPKGKSFYLGTQHWLDMFYPAMLAAVLAFGALGLARGRWRWVAYVVVVAAVVGAAFDYAENARVAGLLVQDVDALSSGDVERAAFATLLKSGLTMIAMIVLLFLLLLRLAMRVITGRGAK